MSSLRGAPTRSLKQWLRMLWKLLFSEGQTTFIVSRVTTKTMAPATDSAFARSFWTASSKVCGQDSVAPLQARLLSQVLGRLPRTKILSPSGDSVAILDKK
jgi:hypothetical protein